MHVRWSAIIFGWLVDFFISVVIQTIVLAAGYQAFFDSPSITNPIHLVLLVVLLLSTSAGGFVAGRIAGEGYTLNGTLVGVVGILVGTLLGGGAAVPPMFIVGQAIGCGFGALGGYCAYLANQRRKRLE